MSSKVYVFGAGGHSKVVIDIIEKSEKHSVEAVVDDFSKEDKHLGYKIINFDEFSKVSKPEVVIAIGANHTREKIFNSIKNLDNEASFLACIHPSVIIGDEVKVAPGTVVMAGAILNSGVKIGAHSIINTGSCIDHDCIIGDFSSVAPGCTLGGSVRIGNRVSLGIGSVVIHGIEISDECVIGASSNIVKNLEKNSFAFGNPCRLVKKYTYGQNYL